MRFMPLQKTELIGTKLVETTLNTYGLYDGSDDAFERVNDIEYTEEEAESMINKDNGKFSILYAEKVNYA